MAKRTGPNTQFYVLNALALIAVLSSPGTTEEHVLLRLSPFTCLYGVIEQCTIAAYTWWHEYGVKVQCRSDVDDTALSKIRAPGILLALLTMLYLTFFPNTVSWTLLFGSSFCTRALSLCLLRSVSGLRSSMFEHERSQADELVRAGVAVVAHVSARVVLVDHKQRYWWLAVCGGVVPAIAVAIAAHRLDDGPLEKELFVVQLIWGMLRQISFTIASAVLGGIRF